MYTYCDKEWKVIEMCLSDDDVDDVDEMQANFHARHSYISFLLRL